MRRRRACATMSPVRTAQCRGCYGVAAMRSLQRATCCRYFVMPPLRFITDAACYVAICLILRAADDYAADTFVTMPARALPSAATVAAAAVAYYFRLMSPQFTLLIRATCYSIRAAKGGRKACAAKMRAPRRCYKACSTICYVRIRAVRTRLPRVYESRVRGGRGGAPVRRHARRV